LQVNIKWHNYNRLWSNNAENPDLPSQEKNKFLKDNKIEYFR